MFLKKIKKRDGRIVDFDAERIKNAVHKAFLAVELGDGEKAVSVTEAVVKILGDKFREAIPTVEDVQDTVIFVLTQSGYENVALEYQDYRKKKEELRALREKLQIEPKLTVNALEVLRARYLLRDEKETIIETPTRLLERVAQAVAKVDKKYGEEPAESQKTFYEIMAKLEFLPNTPTLFNAGTSIGQLSACFVLPVGDSLEDIFNTVKNMALIEQTGGGVGFDFSRLRPKGDIVRSTKGVASGPVSFMRIFDTATEVIKAGGKRRGAMMGILSVDHPDVLEFITAKQNPQLLSNFNVSVAVTDEFMDKVEKDEEHWLINPRNKEKVKTLRAKHVWNLMATSAWTSGDPGVVFIDEINRHNPTPQVGRIEATNPCVPSDTWVMTDAGPELVRSLLSKPFVAVVNGERWNGPREGFFATGVKPVLKLKTKEGFELRLTANHPVLKVQELSRYSTKTEWVKAGELKAEDKIMMNNHGNLQGWSGNHTEGEGYLMGLLLGDGTIKNDKAVLSSWGDEAGSKAVRALAYSYVKDAPHRSDFKGWMKVKGRDEYRMAPSCLRELAKSLGVKPGSKQLTEAMERASSSFCRGLLKGLFDTDGSVQGKQAKGVSIRLAQSNVETLKTVQRILLRLGIFSTVYVNRRSEGYNLMPNGRGGMKQYLHKPQHELVISSQNLRAYQEKIGFGDLDKRSKLEKALSSYKRKLNRERFVATVLEAVPEGREEVFDAQIPGVNAFDANGFYVHNCGEQPLLPYESCNLGSINLSKMVRDGKVNWGKLRETVRNGVHFLDNVVDANVYPLKETGEITRANRKIGLGVMGFADMLIMLGIPYDSDEALKVGEELMTFIEREAHKKSMEIAEAHGSFPNFEGSIWRSKYGAFRNATVTTVAPTGTISIIAGCSSGIEPLFAVSFMRNVLSGARLFETNALFEETAKARGFYSAKLFEEIARTGSVQKIEGVPEDVKRLFVTALDIKPAWHIKMQAAFQKNTDNAVSKCLTKDQLIASSNGILRIEKCGHAIGTDKFRQALEGLKVRDSSGTQRNILSHYSAGLTSARKITLWNGASIEGSKTTHRVLTVDGWKTLGEITTKDLVKVIRRFPQLETAGSKSLLPLGDLKTNANKITVPTNMTPELAKWLGMIAADSCCNEKGGRVGIVVGKGKKEAKTLFKNLTLKLFGKQTKDVPDGRRPSTESIFLTSRQLCRWVFGLIGESSRKRKVPEPVLEGSRSERIAFVEGLTLDGYHSNGHGLVVYDGRSQRLAYEVSEILRAEGKPRVTVCRRKDRYGDSIGICISNELQASFKAIEDHKNKEIIYKDQLVQIDPNEVANIKLPISDGRYSNLRSLKQTRRPYCWERVANELGLTILADVERVRCCEDTGLKEMYDIEVEGSHEYLVNGIISHNTVNLPNEAKVEEVREIYDLAWKLKCKGVTVFRYGSKPEQVLYIGEIKTKEGKFVSAQSEYAGGCPTMNCPFPA